MKKCKNCGAELKETDKICLNCGRLVSYDDLYDEINFEDESSSQDDDLNKELDDLLDSYNINDNKEDLAVNNEEDELEEDPTTNNFEYEDYTEDDNIDLDDEDKDTNKLFNLNELPFKKIIIIAGAVLIVLGGIFGFKFLFGKTTNEADYQINNDELQNKSKYSLTKNPNYIKNYTWVCGESLEDGSLTNNMDTYFQFDFNKNGTYARQFVKDKNTYEDGKYSVSLEDISNDQYTYKIIMIANISGGYQTRYTFTLTTNKEGTKAVYKYNTDISSCEEMNYYNSKYNH